MDVNRGMLESACRTVPNRVVVDDAGIDNEGNFGIAG